MLTKRQRLELGPREVMAGSGMASVVALLMMASVPGHAAQVDLETGETCVGTGCADVEVTLPSTTQQSEEEAKASSPDLCETVAERVRALCMASPDADPSNCAREYERAYDNCSNPPVDTVENDDSSSWDAVCTRPPYQNSSGSGGSSQTAALEESQGIYRVPYADGTTVHICRDFYDHDAVGKIDMAAGSCLPSVHVNLPRIVAAADGCIQYIVDRNSKQRSPNADECYNNYVWIKHANGEWSKYSHMKQGSTTGKAGLKVGDFVTEGTYLGDQGMVGCGWPEHLHFEVAAPRVDRPAIADTSGALAGDEDQRNPVICGIEDRTFQDGEEYVAVAGPGEISPGAEEIMRHGMPFHNYRCFLMRGIAAGYQPSSIDFFDIGNDLHVNVVMRPATTTWASRSGMDVDAFLSENQAFKGEGYRLTHLESYEDGGIRYAGLWEKRSGPAQQVYLAHSSSEHEAKIAELSGQGYRPKTISVVPHSGLKYSAIWEKVDGGWELRSSLTPDEYREKAGENQERGWHVAFLNSYVDNGQAYLSAIWLPGIDGEVRRRTALGKKDFDFEWGLARKVDLKTAALTAYEVDGPAKYTAVFHE